MAHYSGSCQCGNIRFEADTEIKQVLSCNCSRCRRLGSLLAATSADKFKVTSGEGKMAEYKFNKHAIHHKFCPVCGIQPFARGKGPNGVEMVMVNVRCLDGVDAESFPVMKYDGAKM